MKNFSSFAPVRLAPILLCWLLYGFAASLQAQGQAGNFDSQDLSGCPATGPVIRVEVTDMGGLNTLELINNAGVPPTTVTGLGFYDIALPAGIYKEDFLVVLRAQGIFDVLVGEIIVGCPPTNQSCAAAKPLYCGQGQVFGYSLNSSDNGDVLGCNTGLGGWYTFTGTGENYNIRVISEYDLTIGMSSSTDCVNYGPVQCVNDQSQPTGTQQFEGFIVFPTTAGTQYRMYVGLSGDNNTDQFANWFVEFNCSFPGQYTGPYNNDPATAIELTNNGCDVPYRSATNNATQSSTIGPVSCNGTAVASTNDVWFKFTAAFANTTILAQSAQNIRIELFDANYNFIACADDLSGGGTEALIATGLVNGVVHYIRLFTPDGSDAEYTICITGTDGPLNDEIAGAVPLNAAALTCTNPLAGTTAMATASATAAPVCGGVADDDVWYTYTATDNYHVIRVAATADIAIDNAVLINGALQSFGCANDRTDGIEELSINNLTVGQQYYVRVYTAGASASATFDICLLTPPDNDQPNFATVLTPAATCTPVSGSTEGALESGAAGACNNRTGTADDDVFFQFTATTTTAVVRANTSQDAVLEILTDGLVLFGCADANPAGGNEELQLASLVVGDTYYIRLYSFAAATPTTYDICVIDNIPPPANDEAAGAALLEQRATCTNFFGNTVNATQSLPPAACSGTTAATANDVWFKWTATSSRTTFSAGSTEALHVEVRSGDNSTGLFCLALPAGSVSTFTNTGYVPGTTYLIRLYSPTATVLSYQICITGTPDVINSPAAPSCTITNQGAGTGTSGEWLHLGTTPGEVAFAFQDVVGIGQMVGNLLRQTGPVRTLNGNAYLDRSFEIVTTVPPATPIPMRLYFTAAEFAALQAADPSIGSVNDLVVLHDSPGNTCATQLSPGYTAISGTVVPFGTGYYIEFSTPSFSNFYIGGTALLPATLSAFDGRAEKATNRLTWTTEQEHNVDRFEIERSADGTDWQVIGEVQAAGESNKALDYTYLDRAPLTKAYYRLRTVDFDDYAEYSDVVQLTRTGGTGTATLTPNPTRGEVLLTLDHPRAEPVRLLLRDVAGRVLLHMDTELAEGQNQLRVDLSAYPAGLYLLELQGAALRVTERVVKE